VGLRSAARGLEPCSALVGGCRLCTFVAVIPRITKSAEMWNLIILPRGCEHRKPGRVAPDSAVADPASRREEGCCAVSAAPLSGTGRPREDH
jgi:hypothetical protein